MANFRSCSTGATARGGGGEGRWTWRRRIRRDDHWNTVHLYYNFSCHTTHITSCRTWSKKNHTECRIPAVCTCAASHHYTHYNSGTCNPSPFVSICRYIMCNTFVLFFDVIWEIASCAKVAKSQATGVKNRGFV